MQNRQKAVSIISYVGLAILSSAFIYWCLNCGKKLPYVLFALLSALLFAAVCLRFVPRWVDFWIDDAEPEPGKGRRRTEAYIFLCALAMCFAVLLLAWLIKLCTGWQGSFRESLYFWLNLDSRHYLDIARDWYLSEGEWDRLVQLAFLPGYPLAVRLVNVLIGDWLYSALILSALCFAAAAVLLYRLLLLDMDEAASLRGVKYLCLMPAAFFFASPMSESLFLVLSLGCIYLVRRGRWFWCGVLGACAAFTRSLGIVLMVPLIFELFHMRVKLSERLKRGACILLVPLGFMAYCLVNYAVSGDAFKFMEYQSVHWGQKTGWFFNTAAYQLECAVSYFAAGSIKEALGLWCANLVCCFASLALMLPGIKRLRPSYGAYFLCYYIAAIGATWLLSAPRYLAVLFPIPAALAQICNKDRLDLAATLTLGAGQLLYLCAFVLGCQVW